ncbi:membrane protease subunit [Streptomyces sp. 130]|uniref:SPFH domain-containing protein n=1 Tax=Streptomyces sp. 130 TaxID=2591006 RepID=UPI00117F1890|nr:SPFH domain-containing protein [Streptomyces sp. 130]TRV81456.1 membrane protease subunit [Streptomyces sp. 130]
MRSTVSDSSGNPGYGQETEYGTVPVREWVGPGGAGSVTDAWAAGAAADETPVAEGLPVRGTTPAAPRAPEPPPLFRPVSVSVPSDEEVVVQVAEPAAAERGDDAAAGADSVVDLVLDLPSGEEDREASLGATSASVSVPAEARTQEPAEARTQEPADAAPGSAVLGRAVPGSAVPGSAVLEDSVLGSAVPGSAVPGSAVSEDAVPSSAAPGSAVPEGAVPGSAVPEDAVPGSAVPEDAVPAGAVPGDAPAPDLVKDAVPEDAAPEDVVSLAVAPRPEPALALAGARVPGPGPDAAPCPDPVRDSGRHQAVIANERTASIPVHLLFREDRRAGAAAVPPTVVRPAVGEPGVRRPPVPRTPQVRPSNRPAPEADPRLRERPGPALPGWAALLAGFGGAAAAGGVLWWTGAVPAAVLARIGLGPRPYDGLPTGAWAALVFLTAVVLFALGGLGRGRVGHAWVLTLFGQYRGTVRRTGLVWVSPLLLRRRIDVRLRHWRSEPLPAVDANGTALRVVVQVVWRVKDTVRAALGIEDHEAYLREQVEAAMARVLSQLPADAFHEDAHTLRDAEAVGDALTRMLKADCEPVGVEVYSAQPTGIEYAPEVAAAMQRRRIAAIDAQHRDSVLTSVVDAVDDTVSRLTERGLVELDDYERKALVKDLTVAFYTGRTGGDGS